MIRVISLLVLLCSTILGETFFLRSEYETVGTVLGIVENGTGISGGNEEGFYSFNSATGELSIAIEIPDQFNVVTLHELTVETANGPEKVTVVDGYDFMLTNHPGTVLSDHQETDTMGQWTAYNNLWGKGTAIPDRDFRIAILVSDSLPDSSIVIWDAPGKASEFDGASVWCYTNMMFGNRKGQREDLGGFPFVIDSLEELTLNFNYTPILGDDQFKVALNCFLTDEDTLTPFSENDGDFFMVFDQVGTWIPPYPDTVVEDTMIENQPYMLLYKEEAGYEWRRVIIKDHGRLQSGSVDLLGLMDRFAEEGMVDKSQSIPNIQFGVEVTRGFGGMIIHQLEIEKKMKQGTSAFPSHMAIPNPHIRISELGQKLHLTVDQPTDLSVMSLDGRMVQRESQFISGIVGEDLSQGVYLLQVNGVVKKIVIP